jgi:O-antigen/teichoic acid export membrane protein
VTENASGPPPLSAVTSQTSDEALDRSLVHGLAWASAAKWTSQVLAWASTLIVARLLSPEDYGLVGMATIYLGLVSMLSEFGVGTTILALRDLTEEQIAQLHGFAVLFGVAGLALSCIMAWPLGDFFHSAQLPPVVIVMSLAFVISAFRTVPAALLKKALRFRELALIDAVSATVLAVAMIALAWFGFRYWTLVIGGLLSATLAAVQTLRLQPQRLAMPRRGALSHAMTFSWRILVSRLSWYAYSNADFLVAGRLLGKAALGVYDFAWTLANLPIEKITVLLGSVTFPFFAAVQNEPAKMRRYLLGLTEGLALLTFPASVGIALVARDFVLAFLGTKWSGAIVPLQLLAVVMGFRSVAPLLPQVLNVLGDTRFSMYNSLLAAVVMPVAFFLMGSRSGTTGLALAWLTVYPLLSVILYWRVFRRLELHATEYLRAVWPALSSSLVMAAVVLGVHRLVGGALPRGGRLGLEVTSGVLTYLLICLTVHRERILAFFSVIRGRSSPAV